MAKSTDVHLTEEIKTRCCGSGCWASTKFCRPKGKALDSLRDSYDPVVYELNVRSLEVLVSSDNPFLEDVLDSQIFEFLLSKARRTKIFRNLVVRIKVPLPKADANQTMEMRISNDPPEIDQAFYQKVYHNTMESYLDDINAELGQLKGEIWYSVLVSIVGIIFVLLGVFFVEEYSSVADTNWHVFISSIFSILFWVLIWHPFELIMYGKYETESKSLALNRLKHALFEVRYLTDYGSENVEDDGSENVEDDKTTVKEV